MQYGNVLETMELLFSGADVRISDALFSVVLEHHYLAIFTQTAAQFLAF